MHAMSAANPDRHGMPLDGVLVVELGARIAVGAAGGLLAQLGASVVLVEPAAPRADGKWAQRDLFAAGKLSLGLASDADNLGARLLDTADVVLTSSDVDGVAAPPAGAILCDITACGSTGPLAGQALSDQALQALCGIAETTGAADGPPTTIGAPVTEMSAALYGAAAVVAALRRGTPEQIEIALYDCAVNTLTTFLPAHFGGGRPTRVGNWHPLLGPWNVYRARDGWVLICTASEPQWRRLCGMIGQPELADDPRYRAVDDRIQRRPELDALIGAWTERRDVAACIAAVGAAGIPCGPILTIADLPAEPNLAHRGMVSRLAALHASATLRVPGSPFRTTAWRGRAPARVPARDADRAALAALLAARRAANAGPTSASARLPLSGIRVIEIGQYTTAPLATRHLIGLGAEVVRVEPPGGEATRTWRPGRHGLGYFFLLTNGGKRAVALDLASAAGKQALATLLRDADVLVENLKPGALARLGFDVARLSALNPRLIYCAISGFGADAVYPERPAFDAVVQAMSGLMDVTRSGGTPYKAGISMADICGGQFALLAVLAALVLRDRNGGGQAIDLSMQDAAAWLTQTAWNQAVAPAADAPPARTVAEVMAHPQTAARGLVFERTDDAGRAWPALRSPLGLSGTPVVEPGPPGPLLDWPALRAQLALAS
jgi:crotonobetainyl-CoA:carnitine CoA-transferase CaiB-like acyl-CoA transferase